MTDAVPFSQEGLWERGDEGSRTERPSGKPPDESPCPTIMLAPHFFPDSFTLSTYAFSVPML
jgi:hypothetical protein